jgi:hypothetical protein
MDICAGGTVSVGANSISFTNNHNENCTITSCSMPGWPTTAPVITAKTTQSVPLSTPAAAGGPYTYTPNCCTKRTDPQIRVQ